MAPRNLPTKKKAEIAARRDVDVIVERWENHTGGKAKRG